MLRVVSTLLILILFGVTIFPVPFAFAQATSPTHNDAGVYEFNGIDQSISIADTQDISLNTSSSWTFFTWIQTQDSGKNPIVSQYGQNGFIELYIQNNYVYTTITSGNDSITMHSPDTIDSSYHFLALVYDDNSQTLSLVLDGVTVVDEYINSLDTLSFDAQDPIVFGSDNQGNYYNGLLFQYGAHPTALSESVLLHISISKGNWLESVISTDSFMFLFKTDEGGGITSFDASGNQNDATLSSATIHATRSDIPWVWANQVGYTFDSVSSIYLPRDESNILYDVTGSSLQYRGFDPYLPRTTQSYYRWYTNSNDETPTTPWDSYYVTAGENQALSLPVTRPSQGESLRLRMLVSVSQDALVQNQEAFILQYAIRQNSCNSTAQWEDILPYGSTSDWTGAISTIPNGTEINTTVLSLGDKPQLYSKTSPSNTIPKTLQAGEYGEFDWHIMPSNAQAGDAYCFRMIRDNGLPLDNYEYYPMAIVSQERPRTTSWMWYQGGSISPQTGIGTSLAGQRVTPINIDYDDTLELRIGIQESADYTGESMEFSLEFSEYQDFSQNVFKVSDENQCHSLSYWCYTTSSGGEDIITNPVLSDTASGGVVAERNRPLIVTDIPASSHKEFGFRLRQAGARANTTYYFRLYDNKNETYVPFQQGYEYPSISTSGAYVTVSLEGIPAGSDVQGEVIDRTSSSNILSFGDRSESTIEIGHSLSVHTNATGGYKAYMRFSSLPTSKQGSAISAIDATYQAPRLWWQACTLPSTSCVGYRTSDSVLSTGSQFAPVGVYAPASTTMNEIAYTPHPTTDTFDIIYKAWISPLHPAGTYTSTVNYTIIPIY